MLIRCPGCEGIHDSRMLICPNMGRCLACGVKRLTGGELTQITRCCFKPVCSCCGHCHGCHALQYTDLLPCECGYPLSPAAEVALEKFRID
jgi:hypothetical protein